MYEFKSFGCSPWALLGKGFSMMLSDQAVSAYFGGILEGWQASDHLLLRDEFQALKA